MSDTAKILAILVGTALANALFAGWLWRRHGMIGPVRVLLVLAAVLLVNAALWMVRADDGAAPASAAAWDSR